MNCDARLTLHVNIDNSILKSHSTKTRIDIPSMRKSGDQSLVRKLSTGPALADVRGAELLAPLAKLQHSLLFVRMTSHCFSYAIASC
jgi:hypothetical protein